MPKQARVVVILTYHEDTKSLDVFMGDEKPEAGCVKRVVEKDGIDVGVTAAEKPVFIRIPNAQQLNRTFRAIARRGEANEPLNNLQVNHVVKFCLEKTREILPAARACGMPKVAKFVYNSMAEAVA